MNAKSLRQRAILRLVSQSELASQSEVRAMLASHGIAATQATISRDIEELGIVKVRTSEGRLRYAPPESAAAPASLPEQLRRVLGEWVTDITASGSLVVVRTPPGCAHVVASALDRSAMSALVGTVAGDDTVLCVAAESVGGHTLARSLSELAGLEGTQVASEGPRAGRHGR